MLSSLNPVRVWHPECCNCNLQVASNLTCTHSDEVRLTRASTCVAFLLQAHADVLGMAQQVLKEKDAKKRMQLLAALLLHTADLANGADSWSISKLWARWCHQGE